MYSRPRTDTEATGSFGVWRGCRGPNVLKTGCLVIAASWQGVAVPWEKCVINEELCRFVREHISLLKYKPKINTTWVFFSIFLLAITRGNTCTAV